MGKQIKVKAFVLHKVTAGLPTVPVSPVTRWKQLSHLEFVDPNYGTQAHVQILLEGEV